MSEFMVEVPPGVGTGATLQARSPAGVIVNVQVPPGVVAGQQFKVAAPPPPLANVTDSSMIQMEIEKQQNEENMDSCDMIKSCCFATCCPGVLTYNLCLIKGYPRTCAACGGFCACSACVFLYTEGLPMGLCCFFACPPKKYPKAYKFEAPPLPLKKMPKFIKGKTKQKENEKALLRHYRSRFSGAAKKFKGLDVDKLSQGFAKGISLANMVAPDSIAMIESYVHGALPAICEGENFQNGVRSLRNIISSYNEMDPKEKQNLQIKAGVILGKIVLNILKVAIPGAGPILSIIGKALELAADPVKREKIRKHPGTEIAKLVITIAFQSFVPIPGVDNVLDDLLDKVFETAGEKLTEYINSGLDKRVANGKNKTAVDDFKKSSDELRKEIFKEGGKMLNDEARKMLKDLGNGVIEMIKQQLMEALSLHGINFLELIPCCPANCCAPSADSMDRGDEGEISMPDETGFFDGEPPFEATEKLITEGAIEIKAIKKAAKASEAILKINKAIRDKSEDGSSDFKFENASSELTSETMIKLDWLTALMKDEVEGKPDIIINLEGRSPVSQDLAQQRARAAHEYLMSKGASDKYLGHTSVVHDSFEPSLVLAAGQPVIDDEDIFTERGNAPDTHFTNPAYGH